MPTRLVHLVVDAAEPARLARFWAGALGWEVAAEEPDEVDVWPPGFGYPDPSALPLVFVPVAEPKNGKNRLHLDLATESARPQAAEGERLGAPGGGGARHGRGGAAARAGCGARRHRAGRRAVDRAGRPGGQRVLRPRPAADL